MKKLFLIVFAVLLSMGLWAQADYTEEFAVKDTNHLMLDVYMPTIAPPDTGFPCFVYVFGGGFIGGRRDEADVHDVGKPKDEENNGEETKDHNDIERQKLIEIVFV